MECCFFPSDMYKFIMLFGSFQAWLKTFGTPLFWITPKYMCPMAAQRFPRNWLMHVSKWLNVDNVLRSLGLPFDPEANVRKGKWMEKWWKWIPSGGRSHIPPWESRNIIDSKLAFLGDMFVSRRVIPSSLTQKLAPSRNQGFFDGSLDRWPVISRRGIAAVGCGNVFKKTGWIPFLPSSLNDAFETSESLISSYKEAITRCWFQKIWQVV